MTEQDDLPRHLRDTARGYNNPPELKPVDLDAMWPGIEASAFAEPRLMPNTRHMGSGIGGFIRRQRLVPLAAALVLGVAIGRFGLPRAQTATVAAAADPRADSVSLPEPYQTTATRYLGQTAALLVALPAELQSGQPREPYMGRAHDLLLTTRLLLDSPAAADPRMRTLLEDLELVLAQVVRLQSAESGAELELIRQALEQRDVLPRLRTAVADMSADD